MYAKHRDYFGRDDDDVLVVQGGTLAFNPSIDAGVIERARTDDPQAALSEWDAEFRTDLSQFLDDASIDGSIDHARPLELPPRENVAYRAFTDASAGRHDAFTISVCHRDGERVIADVVRGRKPPFDPASVAKEFASLAREYGCGFVTGDNYAPGWVAGAFRDAGVEYKTSRLTRSETYIESLPLWTRGLVGIPNQPQLVRELRLLERRCARSGKDSVDHGPSGSDDFANSLCGALVLAAAKRSDAIVGPVVGLVPRIDPALVGELSNPVLGEAVASSPAYTGTVSPWDSDPTFRELGGGAGAGISLRHLGIG
jgi:hypothetical protein